MELSEDLIDYIKTNGEILNNTDSSNNINIHQQEKYKQAITEKLDQMNNTLAYDIDTPIPGTETKVNLVDPKKIKKTTDKLMADAAMAKLRRQNKKPIEERAKEYYINAVINQQKTAYLEKYGFAMTGDLLRKTKRMIIRKYNSGKLRPNEKEYNDIVDFLNSPLNDPDNKKANPMNTANTGVSQQLGSLISSI